MREHHLSRNGVVLPYRSARNEKQGNDETEGDPIGWTIVAVVTRCGTGSGNGFNMTKEIILFNALPDGRIFYEMSLHEHHQPICLGKLFVENDLIVLRATGDTYGRGSIVTPSADWVGDMAFSVSPIEKT